MCKDLSAMNLVERNLWGADLWGADLGGAKGVVCLPVGDPTYRPVAVDQGGKWMIASGCRWFTVAEVRNHCGAAHYARGRLLGDQYLAAMDWLEDCNEQIRQQWSR